MTRLDRVDGEISWISWIVLRPLIASMATRTLNSGLWVRRLLIVECPDQGRYPASEVNDGAYPEKPDHLNLVYINPNGQAEGSNWANTEHHF